MPEPFTQVAALLRNVPKHDAWPKERDRLGGKSGAVSSVSMAKSLEKFHKKFDAEQIDASRSAIASLTKDVTKYAKEVLKSTPKLAAYLNKQVLASLEQLDELLQNGPAEQHQKAKDILAPFRKLVRGVSDKLPETKVPPDLRDEWAEEKAKLQELLDKTAGLIPEEGWVDLGRLEAEANRGMEVAQKFTTKWLQAAQEFARDKEMKARAEGQEPKNIPSLEPDFEDAEDHWIGAIVPALAGEMNRLLLQHHVGCTLEDAEQVINKVCVTLQPINEKKFNPITHSAKQKKDANPLHKELVEAGIKLLEAAIIPVSKGLGRKDTDLFVFRAPVKSEKKTGKKIEVVSEETRNEKGLDFSFGEIAKKVKPAKLIDVGKLLIAQGNFPHHQALNKAMADLAGSLEKFRDLGDRIFKLTSPDEAFKALGTLKEFLNDLATELDKLPPESQVLREVILAKAQSMYDQLEARIG